MILRLIPLGLPLILSPLLMGCITRVKAFFSGRKGPPLLQVYFDLWKLLQKDFIYSRTTTWVFRVAPAIGLSCVLMVLCLLPLGGTSAVVSFDGDLLVLIGLLGLMRFFTVIAALDTGSSFEGMGASREVYYSAVIEPALFLGIVTLVYIHNKLTMSGLLFHVPPSQWTDFAPLLLLVTISFFILLLAENCRIPFDDPNTHLELTMIHEVMVLDYAGWDLGLILYASSLKLWIFCVLVAGVFIPLDSMESWQALGVSLLATFFVAVLVGVIESVMARFRLIRVPQFIVGAGMLSLLAFLLAMSGRGVGG